MPLSTSQYGFIIDPMVPFTDASGTTIRNGYVRVFVAGSSTPVITYKNYDGATNEETIQLDNSGRTAYPVIVSKGNTYKVCVYDAEHSQESPILTIDKVVPAGANVEATNIVTGLDNVESPEAGWVKSTVSGTDAEVSLDATNVTSEVDTMVKATAASADYMMPLVHKTGSDPDKKITLGNIFKFVLNFIHSLTDTATESDLVSGNYFALDGSAGTKKLNSTTLLTKTAQNALAGNVAPEFDPTRDEDHKYLAGESVTYDGKVYTFKVDHYGAWNFADVYLALPTENKLKAGQNLTGKLLEDCFDIEFLKVVAGYDDNNTSVSIITDTPFVLKQDLQGAIISALGLNFYSRGTFSVGICKKVPVNNEEFSNSDIEVFQTFYIENVGYNLLQIEKPFAVPSGCRLFVGINTDTARFKFGDYGTKGFFYVNHITNKYIVNDTRSLGIDVFGCDDQKIKDELDFLNTCVQGTDKEFINGYSENNTTTGTYSTAPYILDQEFNSDVFLEKIQINVLAAGSVTVGTIKKVDVVVGDLVDYSKFKIKQVFDTDETGVQEFVFDKKVKVSKDELVFVGWRFTDTLTFYYGNQGSDKGFVYINNGRFVHSSSSVNVIVSGFQPSTSYSVYRGKKISILGDSISTFAGYIPEGNATYYPSGSVQSVKDTWWKKLIDALGLVLDVNNSWSGSRVTTTNGETSSGCGDRAEALGTSPDVIIVWMGINDFNNEVALGTYDGKSAVPATTTTFREAYAIMLNKILTKYQSAEVWVCTLPQCERNGSSGFPEINGNGVALADFNAAILELANAFGVKVLDHNKCGLTYQNMPTFNTDQLHPNKYGHSLVANNDIREMDNFVRTRYSIG